MRTDLKRYIRKLLNNSKLRRTMGEQGVKQAREKWTWQAAAERMRDIHARNGTLPSR